MQPIGPALAELLNPAINRGDAGMGSGTGLQPPPDNSGTAAPAARPPRIARAGVDARSTSERRRAKRDACCPNSLPPREPRAPGLDEAPQANYGTAATIPTLDPELAKQLGFTTEEEDAAALARPPRNKMEALGVAATADALDA